jgi:hypothetical protein
MIEDVRRFSRVDGDQNKLIDISEGKRLQN